MECCSARVIPFPPSYTKLKWVSFIVHWSWKWTQTTANHNFAIIFLALCTSRLIQWQKHIASYSYIKYSTFAARLQRMQRSTFDSICIASITTFSTIQFENHFQNIYDVQFDHLVAAAAVAYIWQMHSQQQISSSL